MRVVVLACALILASRTNAVAQDVVPRPPEITASGRGEISVAAEHAVLTVTVETSASSASTAASENARLVGSTLEKLRAAGAKEAELTNGGYSLNQDYENGDRRRPRGFVARNSIRIEVPHVADVGKLIDAAISGGATIVSPIQYVGPNLQVARRDALKAAVSDATRDAQTLAEASGGSLGRLLSLTTTPAMPIYNMNQVVATGMMETPGMGTSIRPTDLMVTAVATGRWEFVPRR